MSHAANLRKYRPQHQNNVAQKRRKLSSTVNPSEKLTNGVPYPSKSISAIPSTDAKASKQASTIKDNNAIISYQPAVDRLNEKDSSSSDSDDNDDSGDISTESSSDDEQENDQISPPIEPEGSAVSSSSDSGSDSDSDSSKNDDAPPKQNEHAATSADQPNQAEESEEPSFGDLLALRAPEETIHVELSPEDSAHPNKALATSSTNQTLTVPSANSLGTVLTQALKTNDIDLLESCLHVPNLESIRATIERIHPSHAATLLQRLAERLHKRPGRAGSLMVWVQWTVVAHGGYLASQPDAMRELRTLYQVVKQRASGLQPLLALKGKLDMLEAQMQLRRNMQARSKASHPGAEEDDVLYVEGEAEIESDDGQKGSASSPRNTDLRGRNGNMMTKKSFKRKSSDDMDDDELLSKLPNGIPGDRDESDKEGDDEEEEEESNSSVEGGDLIDDEAEESDDSSSEMSEDIDYDDVDSDGDEDVQSGDDEEDETELPPAKRVKAVNAKSSKQRR